MINWDEVAAANTKRTLAQANLANAQASALGMPKTETPAPVTNISVGIPSQGPAQPPAGGSNNKSVIDNPYVTPSSTSYLDRALKLGTKSNFLGQQVDDLGEPIRARKGLTRVPGKGNGKKDTVKAKLAPGEAVLNKAAADGMGRGLISALNKVGAKKMGLV